MLQKIAGAAQRRNKLGLLIQGSVQPPPLALARAEWETAMLTVASRDFQVAWTDFSPDDELQRQAERLILEKYGSDDYNARR